MPHARLLLGWLCAVVIVADATTRRRLGSGDDCDDGITCAQLHANGMTFDCRFSGSAGPHVMLLHGFPEWSSMYSPLMRQLAARGFRCVACDQRGYSPGASPDNVTAYNYRLLASDVWALADAAKFPPKFHLVGHDHGAVLGWTVAASEQGAARLLSYSALSVPHVDAFSAGLFGPGADLAQQLASQYFTMFVLNNSASLHTDFWFLTLGLSDGFHSAASFQRALWWYNGAMDAGVMAMPPLMPAGYLYDHGSYSGAALRKVFGGTPNPGFPAKHPSGNVTVPSLYVCGTTDPAILCNRPYALGTKSLVEAEYQYLAVDCGHDLLSCSKSAETAKVTAAIAAHLAKHSGAH